MSVRENRSGRQTKEWILETACRLFNEYGTAAISTKRIAKEMGISPGNLYYHFKNKELPIEGHLYDLYRSSDVADARRNEGRHPFCEGCAVNCYIRASLFRRFDRYFLPSIISGAKYLYETVRMRMN